MLTSFKLAIISNVSIIIF